jgi:hypothetical protein
MTKADPVDHNLALVRAATAPPYAAKARVRGALARTLPTPPDPLRQSAAWKGLGLLGLGLVAGYFIGIERAGEPAAPRAPLAAAAPSERFGGDPGAQALRDTPAATEDSQPPARGSAPGTEPAGDGGAGPDARAGTGSPHARAGTRNVRSPSNATARPATGASVAELMLLSRAERAIRSGNGELALAFVAELEQSHPQTRFSEERQAMRVLAECLTREAQARARAEAFLAARPVSVYSDRVRRLCTLASSASADGSNDGAH